MSYKPLKPNWYFSHVNIEAEENIKKDMLNLLNREDFHNNNLHIEMTKSHFSVVGRDKVLKLCPLIKDFLIKENLIDIFSKVLFSVGYRPNITNNAIHVDTYLPKVTQMSLNFPLRECQGSYTAFYSTNNKELELKNLFGIDPRTSHAFAKDEDCKEIIIVELINPILINTTVLHRGIVNNDNRTIGCLRFSRALNIEEVKRLGIIKPFVQE